MHQLLSWQWSPGIVAILLMAGIAYAVGWIRVRRSYKNIATVGRLICWFSGLLVFAIAVLSALHALSYSLLSVRMIQLMLLIELAPPLLLLARPMSILQTAFASRRASSEAGVSSPLIELEHDGHPAGSTTMVSSLQNPLLKGGAFILKPTAAWVIATITLVFWHLPVAYDYAMAHESVLMYGEYLSLFVGHLIWWHPLIGSIPQLPYLSTAKSRLFYLLAGMVVPMPLGILLTFWPNIIYTFYLDAPAVAGISHAFDQQLGGNIMLAYGMAVLFIMGYPLQYYDRSPLSWP